MPRDTAGNEYGVGDCLTFPKVNHLAYEIRDRHGNATSYNSITGSVVSTVARVDGHKRGQLPEGDGFYFFLTPPVKKLEGWYDQHGVQVYTGMWMTNFEEARRAHLVLPNSRAIYFNNNSGDANVVPFTKTGAKIREVIRRPNWLEAKHYTYISNWVAQNRERKPVPVPEKRESTGLECINCAAELRYPDNRDVLRDKMFRHVFRCKLCGQENMHEESCRKGGPEEGVNRGKRAYKDKEQEVVKFFFEAQEVVDTVEKVQEMFWRRKS